MKGKPTEWSAADIEYLKANYPHQWNKNLATHFGLGWRTIVRKARELKLEKAPDFRDNIDFTSFNKGISPKKKGLPQSMFASPEGIEKSKQTQFKKGNIPPNIIYPGLAKKAAATRKKNNKERLLKKFEKQSELIIKQYNNKINSLKEEFKC